MVRYNYRREYSSLNNVSRISSIISDSSIQASNDFIFCLSSSFSVCKPLVSCINVCIINSFFSKSSMSLNDLILSSKFRIVASFLASVNFNALLTVSPTSRAISLYSCFILFSLSCKNAFACFKFLISPSFAYNNGFIALKPRRLCSRLVSCSFCCFRSMMRSRNVSFSCSIVDLVAGWSVLLRFFMAFLVSLHFFQP